MSYSKKKDTLCHMYSKRLKSSAFSLVELGVVVLLIGILVGGILTARSIIESARINKIGEEYNGIKRAILTFESTYDCVPGNCTATKFHKMKASALATSCLGLSLNGHIESAKKRQCMMYELQLDGAISGITFGTSLTETFTSRVNAPSAKANNNLGWDVISVPVARYDSVAATVLPPEAGVIGTGLEHWGSNMVLILRVGAGPDALTNLTSTGKFAGVSSRMTHALDVKFDDGLPYSGIISGLKNPTGQTSVARGTSCNTAVISRYGVPTVAELNFTSRAYLVGSTSEGDAESCMIGFLIEK